MKIFRRSSIATLVAITITTIAIFLSSVSIFFIFLSKDFSDRVKKNIEINVYLADSINSNNYSLIQNRISQKKFIDKIKFISNETAAQEFIKETGEDFRTVLEENPLPSSFSIKLKPEKVDEKNFENLINEVKEIAGIEDVVYDYSVVVKILRLLQSIQYFIYTAAILLILLSVYLVYSNNRIQFENNQNLYNTMKLVGTKLSSIKIPILFYSLLIGLISSIICFAVNYVILNLLTTININLKFSTQFKGIHLITLFLGLMLGLLGSYFSSMKLSLKVSERNN